MFTFPYILPPDDPGYFPTLALHSQDLVLRVRYEEMRRDCHIRSSLGKLNSSITGRELLIDPGGTRSKDKKAVDIAKKILKKIDYGKICESLLDAHYIGVAFAYVREWKNEDSVLFPSFDYLPWWRFAFYPKEDNENIPMADDIKLQKGEQIATHLGYEVRLLTKRRPVTGERVPESRIIVYNFGSDYYPYGLGLAWSYYPHWLTKNAARDAIIRQAGRVGNPPIIGEHPESIDANDPSFVAWSAFLRAVSPNGYFTGAKGKYEAKQLFAQNTTEHPEYLIKFANDEISKVTLGEVPLSESGHGSYGANESQSKDRDENVIDAHTIWLNKCLSSSLWTAIAKLNYPSAEMPNIRLWTNNEDLEREIAEKNEQKENQKAKDEIDRRDKEVQILKEKADLWNTLINQVGLTPDPDLVEQEFGKGWKMAPKQDDLSNFGSSDDSGSTDPGDAAGSPTSDNQQVGEDESQPEESDGSEGDRADVQTEKNSTDGSDLDGVDE